MKRIEEAIGLAATRIAKDIDANIILSIEPIQNSDYNEDDDVLNIKVVIFRKVREKVFKKLEYASKIKSIEFGSITPIKEIIMEAITKNYINRGDKIICTHNSSLGFGYKGVLFIFDVDETFFQISRHKLSENIGAGIIESVLEIAKEISIEGREGRRIGTAFIIGDSSELSKYLKQLIINPFLNLNEKPKITDPKIRETIKEFSQLDGVFIINNEGDILSAGTYINIDHSGINLPEGFGAKHRATMALTSQTESLAVVVSESGGKVRVIKNGKIILKI